MASISIEQPPDEIELNTSAYLNRQFISINLALNETNIMPQILDIPNSPINGTVVYFKLPVNNTVITQAGFWGYEEGAWIKL